MPEKPITELCEFTEQELNRLRQIEAAPYAPEAWPVAGAVARAEHERAVDEVRRATTATQEIRRSTSEVSP